MNEGSKDRCPECGGSLESGFLQAPAVGICWIKDPAVKLGFMFSPKVEKLQKDWWGFPKLTKDKLPARRCRRCKLVIFKYTAETANEGADPSSQITARKFTEP